MKPYCMGILSIAIWLLVVNNKYLWTNLKKKISVNYGFSESALIAFKLSVKSYITKSQIMSHPAYKSFSYILRAYEMFYYRFSI